MSNQVSNDLRHRMYVNDQDGNDVVIDIRLNETGRNGHEDFAITGTVYEKGKPHTDKYFLSGGCIHETIEGAAPELIPFIRLHLSDADGVPMHAAANGFYFLENGFNNVKKDDPKFPAKFCEYYRVSTEQFKILRTAQNQVQFALHIESLGILKQWKKEARAAVAELEKMTGKKFKSNATRSNWVSPTKKQRAEEAQRAKSGYYTEEATQERAEQSKRDKINKIRADLVKTIAKETLETNIKIRVFELGGDVALENSIFYTHCNELKFNWREREMVSAEEIKRIGKVIKEEFPQVKKVY